MPRISVLVLAYNIEEYLHTCLESVLSQTFTDYEVVLVDNGSQDNSKSICADFAARYNQVRLIRLENNIGISGARNLALREALGEYVVFVDSDDYVDRRFLEVLYNSLVTENADASIVGFKAFWKEEEIADIQLNDQKIVASGAEAVKRVMRVEEGFTPHPWAKLYKRSIFDDIKFPIDKSEDDQFVTPKALYKSKMIVSSLAELYYFRQRRESTMHQKFSIKRFDVLEAMDDNICYFSEKGESAVIQEIVKRKAIHQYECVVQARKHGIVIPTKYNISNRKALKKMIDLIDDDNYICYYVSKYNPNKAKILSYQLKIKRKLGMR